MVGSAKTMVGWLATNIGDMDARMNIKTGSKAEAKFPPPSSALPVMTPKQVRGVVMGYGGLALKTSIRGLYHDLQNDILLHVLRTPNAWNEASGLNRGRRWRE